MSRVSHVICLVGPTASGKTAVSVALSELLGNVEIVSADSLAVYKYLDVGTAKPKKEIRTRIPHHLVDFLEPSEQWSAYDFRREALRLFREISSRGNVPMVVGGTAFYLHVLLQGIPFPGAPRDRHFRLVLERMENEKLFALLKSIDPYRAEKIGRKDRKRLIRALEIFLLTQHPPSERRSTFRKGESSHYLLLGISWDKVELKARIRERVREMFRQGIVEEVQNLFALGYRMPLPALENFTYRPIVDFLEGRLSLEEAKEKIVGGTILFMKRQMNWFRKMPVIWFHSEGGGPSRVAERMYHCVQKNLWRDEDGGKERRSDCSAWEDQRFGLLLS
ncbi:MAG: tRNA (adenosine(37)-N6)-dimethylallyltransferase MiaA [Candidatus Caldatribacteriaceae bacterium]